MQTHAIGAKRSSRNFLCIHNPATVVAAVIASVVAASAVGCSAPVTPGSVQSAEPGSSGGDDAERSASRTKKTADFTLETIDGKTVSLSDYVGNSVVLLDFWATWCEPCLQAMPHLNEIYRKHQKSGFVLLSISMDGPDTVAEVRSYARRQNLSFPILLDEESRAVSLYNPRRSAPYAVLIARDGSILHRRDGFRSGDEVAIEAEVVEALSR